MILKNSTVKINRLTPFKEIISVYYDNHMRPTNTLWAQTHRYILLRQVVHIITSGL
jgi:hypothetical protein